MSVVFATLSDVKPGDHIVWKPFVQLDEYDVMYQNTSTSIQWCGIYFNKQSKTIINEGRYCNIQSPYSLEDATLFLAALNENPS